MIGIEEKSSEDLDRLIGCQDATLWMRILKVRLKNKGSKPVGTEDLGELTEKDLQARIPYYVGKEEG